MVYAVVGLQHEILTLRDSSINFCIENTEDSCMRIADLSDIHSGYTARGRLDPVHGGGVSLQVRRKAAHFWLLPKRVIQRSGAAEVEGTRWEMRTTYSIRSRYLSAQMRRAE